MGSRDRWATWQRAQWGEKCIENLKRNDFDAHFVANCDAANDLVRSMISGYHTFGIGGSDTIRSAGILEILTTGGNKVYDHWQEGLTPETSLDSRLQQGRCDCFFCSANAISVTGEIVNVDGVGNRTNAMSFGPKKVIIVAGMNKVTLDLESALKRVREIAGPMRTKSLEMNTPCAETGVCSDCHSPQRICRITTILHRKPMLTDISIILVNESLGF